MKALEFGAAFKYPFNRPVAMWNILWVFLPVLGWFALLGYGVRIVQGFAKGDFKELPVMNFSDDMSLGFMMLLKGLPFAIAFMFVTYFFREVDMMLGGLVEMFLSLFVVPLLAINFFKKQTVASFFEFKVLNAVFKHFGDYFVALLKSIGLGLTFLLMWVILVGIPAGAFTQNIFMADFYRRRVK
jgi:hypothetical protein